MKTTLLKTVSKVYIEIEHQADNLHSTCIIDAEVISHDKFGIYADFTLNHRFKQDGDGWNLPRTEWFEITKVCVDDVRVYDSEGELIEITDTEKSALKKVLSEKSNFNIFTDHETIYSY